MLKLIEELRRYLSEGVQPETEAEAVLALELIREVALCTAD